MARTGRRRAQRKGPDGLNDRQRRFAAEYLVSLNATQAAIKAGYSPRSAGVQAHELLKNPKIAALLAASVRKTAESLDMSREGVLREAFRLARYDVGEAFGEGQKLRDVKSIPEDTRRAIAGVTFDETGAVKSLKFAPKHSSVELLFKYFRLVEEGAQQPPQAEGDTVIRRRAPDGTVVELGMPRAPEPVVAPVPAKAEGDA